MTPFFRKPRKMLKILLQAKFPFINAITSQAYQSLDFSRSRGKVVFVKF